MKKRIKIKCVYDEKIYTLSIDETATREDIARFMQKEYGVPQDATMMKTTGSPWEPWINEGDELNFVVNDRQCGLQFFDLYGCPIADDVPGNVPECMLIEFEEFETIKL